MFLYHKITEIHCLSKALIDGAKTRGLFSSISLYNTGIINITYKLTVIGDVEKNRRIDVMLTKDTGT